MLAAEAAETPTIRTASDQSRGLLLYEFLGSQFPQSKRADSLFRLVKSTYDSETSVGMAEKGGCRQLAGPDFLRYRSKIYDRLFESAERAPSKPGHFLRHSSKTSQARKELDRWGTWQDLSGSHFGSDYQGDGNMLSRIVAAAALAAALATTAYAAGSSSGSSMNSAMNNATATNGAAATSNAQQTVQNLPQEIRAKLKDDGFTNVKVVAGSFIVSAKDKRGEPVTMMIGPNSMMMMTKVTNGSGSSTNNQK